jgi:hypothetical protein
MIFNERISAFVIELINEQKGSGTWEKL